MNRYKDYRYDWKLNLTPSPITAEDNQKMYFSYELFLMHLDSRNINKRKQAWNMRKHPKKFKNSFILINEAL